MRKPMKGQGLVVVFSLLVCGATSFVVGQRAEAQQKDKVKYNVVYDCGASKVKILSCEGQAADDRCEVLYVNKYSPGGGSRDKLSRAFVMEHYVRKCTPEGGAAPDKDEQAETNKPNKNNEDKDQTREDHAVKEKLALDECSSDDTLIAKSKPTDSMELKSKRAILARYQQRVEAREYWAVGIVFESFQIGPPRTNLRGDTLYHETTPVGAKIYPVKTKFTVCERYDTEIKRTVIDGRKECFKDNFGEWVCASASGDRTISTKYEKVPKWKAK